jgi:hypothetical protein
MGEMSDKGFLKSRWAWLRGWRDALIALLIAGTAGSAAAGAAPPADADAVIARSLAEMLRDGLTVISDSQQRIDDPELGDKHLSSKVVLAQIVKIYSKTMGVDPTKVDPASRQGRLLRAMMDSIADVMDANQSTINAKGTGFKGFIPAVFARLVDEAFGRRAKGEAEIKVTTRPELVRNRKARPDAWEAEIIKTKLLAPDWPRGQLYSAATKTNGHPAFRVMVPEYYEASCLACHGSPEGEMDITGYPKEGSKPGELGGVISITLYH